MNALKYMRIIKTDSKDHHAHGILLQAQIKGVFFFAIILCPRSKFVYVTNTNTLLNISLSQ
jgi:hypothetical protein